MCPPVGTSLALQSIDRGTPPLWKNKVSPGQRVVPARVVRPGDTYPKKAPPVPRSKAVIPRDLAPGDTLGNIPPRARARRMAPQMVERCLRRP